MHLAGPTNHCSVVWVLDLSSQNNTRKLTQWVTGPSWFCLFLTVAKFDFLTQHLLQLPHPLRLGLGGQALKLQHENQPYSVVFQCNQSPSPYST
ncbi:hypothetical protein NPIL_346381 [Nephila pilipes]|uniref:Uncharacterized protein n=1 Tax=Nephila pilipes TaxID=299642 RepID=A0A8X6P5A8_NEPPI|nr:hypothetical protein NPIL_346381 [Nephila pilipes]